MGGYGSSRWGTYDKKEIVENCRALSIFELNQLGFLQSEARTASQLVWHDYHSGWDFGGIGLVLDTMSDMPHLRLIYNIGLRGRIQESVDYFIKLEPMPCNLGGKRWWMRCPLDSCERRAAKLYLPPGERYFGCRECHRLSYESCQDKQRYYERPQFDMQLNG